MGRGLRKALSNGAAAVVNYLLGRDMDGITLPEPKPKWTRRVRVANARKAIGPTLGGGKLIGGRPGLKRGVADGEEASLGSERTSSGDEQASFDYGESMARSRGAHSMGLVGHRERARLAEAVEAARQEWVAARNYFDQVVDPDLVDFAVLSIGAAEKRYMFLLSEARRAGVQVDPLTLNV